MAMLFAEPQLFTADMDAALAHYGRLGFAARFIHGDPPFYAQMIRDGARLNLRLAEGAVTRQAEADALSATIVVDDIPGLFDEFQRAGIPFHQPLRTESWGASTFVVADSDGNLIAFAA